jgi:glycosyltransferase involved in cell wall biosynthesis
MGPKSIKIASRRTSPAALSRLDRPDPIVRKYAEASRELAETRARSAAKLTLFGPWNDWTGYGRLVQALGRQWLSQGAAVSIQPHGTDVAPKLPWTQGGRLLMALPPDLAAEEVARLKIDPRQVSLLTMWESSKWPAKAWPHLFAFREVIVPNAFNAACLSAVGVRNVRTVPLGIDLNHFRPLPPPASGPFVFGAAGRLAHGGCRKGLDSLVDQFQRAFPGRSDVALHIKTWSDVPLQPFSDPRIRVTTDRLDDSGLRAWYRGIHAFVDASHCEGWGFHVHEAMACGRPVITMGGGGVAEFWTADCGWKVPSRMVPAAGVYRNHGMWFAAPDNAWIHTLQTVAAGGWDSRRAQQAAERAAEFTEQRMAAAVQHDIDLCH